MPTPFSSWWVALHTTTDQSYGNQGSSSRLLLQVFSQHLTTSSLWTVLIHVSKHCLSIHIGFNTPLKMKKRRKINPTMSVWLSERTSVLVCRHVWSQVPRSQWKYCWNSNALQACLKRKARTWWGARTEMFTWTSTGSLGGNSQVVMWPALETLYLWGCCYKLRNMQLWNRINYLCIG